MKKTLLGAAIVAMAGVASAALYVPNGQFDTGDSTGWAEAQGGGATTFAYPTTGGNGGGYATMENAGGWAVLVNPPEAPGDGGGLLLGSLGITAGTTATITMDMINLAGTGVGGIKIETYDDLNVQTSNTGDMPASGQSSSWATYTWDVAIPLAATKIVFVPLWGADSTVGYDNVGVVPEPATLGLLGIAGGAMIFLRRHFKV